MHIHTYTRIRTYVHTYLHTHTYIPTHTHICIYTDIYIYTHTYKHTHELTNVGSFRQATKNFCWPHIFPLQKLRLTTPLSVPHSSLPTATKLQTNKILSVSYSNHRTCTVHRLLLKSVFHICRNWHGDYDSCCQINRNSVIRGPSGFHFLTD